MDSFIGAVGAGVLSGAVACMAYSWLWLIAHDRLYVYLPYYEPYALPIFCLYGATIGFVTALWVGRQLWMYRPAVTRLGLILSARRLLWAICQGAMSGALTVSLVALFLALFGGRHDIRFICQVNLAGAVVGAAAAAPLPCLIRLGTR